ncbi:hypothetical protein BBO99_00005309 [Phytophthora kernoviae]|uniref:C2 domain-containing protein n=2 Tax=Phytophthora kernoviae TaxID=325452 RepID=A0A421FEL8_9STRA|nr:hypothetical protein G195_008819 [Phytophthora kernoviae 00238/432]KAG2518586.1 hypothetical protein JM16_005241 [Phytophthora kernoviae]KAG2520147.1 hypothetical protein JM18_004902 [Phytophthora kernoviae]RLN43613.1 hypothetical protein BBI17_005513 [Phytophthora kernoviae]RLN79375.1 hypothetical protein BBO99_00005309 [Phytophthora kernoviae]
MANGKKKFVLNVVLFKCHDLAAADMDVVGGKSDPYVVFKLGDETKKSSCIMNNLNPQWSPPEKFQFELDEWENEFLIAQVYDYDRLSKDDLIGSAVIPLTLYAGDRHYEMYSYPLVLPDEVGGLGAPRSDLFLQISLSATDGSPVEMATVVTTNSAWYGAAIARRFNEGDKTNPSEFVATVARVCGESLLAMTR